MQRQTASQRRQTGLDRLSQATRWIVAGAIGSVGVLTAVVAHVVPGHARAPSSTATNGMPTRPGSVSPLQPPAQAPVTAPAYTAPQVITGGS